VYCTSNIGVFVFIYLKIFTLFNSPKQDLSTKMIYGNLTLSMELWCILQKAPHPIPPMSGTRIRGMLWRLWSIFWGRIHFRHFVWLMTMIMQFTNTKIYSSVITYTILIIIWNVFCCMVINKVFQVIVVSIFVLAILAITDNVFNINIRIVWHKARYCTKILYMHIYSFDILCAHMHTYFQRDHTKVQLTVENIT
jgi:hypothetical protein